MGEKKHIIWDNFNIDYESWEKDLRMDFPEQYEDYDEYDMYQEIDWLNSLSLDNERANLNIKVDDDIIVIGSLGLWDGRVSGYKIIESRNISDCLYDNDCDYGTWFVDDLGDLRFEGAHHDSKNYYLYRTWKDGISDVQKENFLEKLYYGKFNRRDITRYTRRLGDEISKVYGWKYRR